MATERAPPVVPATVGWPSHADFGSPKTCRLDAENIENGLNYAIDQSAMTDAVEANRRLIAEALKTAYLAGHRRGRDDLLQEQSEDRMMEDCK